MRKFKVGDRVRIIEGSRPKGQCIAIGLSPEVIGKEAVITAVSTYSDRKAFGVDYRVSIDGDDDGWYIEEYNLEQMEKPVQLYPMDIAVLTHLQKTGHITNVEAHAVLKCRSVSKRISNLRRAGHPIHAEFKKDSQGQRYARYVMA